MVTFFGLVGFAVILTVGLSMLMPMILTSPPTLTRPVDCEIGVECFIQNYVDMDSKEGSWSDYRCGHLSYDGHKGTDFRTRNLVQMQQGVNVVAAADGTVLRVRDGMPDTSIRSRRAIDVDGKECGNGVVIGHSNGFTTQYCHMKQGSIAVKPDDDVRRGQKLGEIGLSGSTEFPHLHFTMRDKNEAIVDPFSGIQGEADCANTENHTNLWHPQYRKEMAYQTTALLGYGFTDKSPNSNGVRNGHFTAKSLSATADPFIFWVDLMALHQGDELIMQLYGPNRVALVNHSKKIDSNKAQYFQFIGSRLQNDTPWAAGTYSGHVRVVRDGKDALNKTVQIEVMPLATPEPDAASNDSP